MAKNPRKSENPIGMMIEDDLPYVHTAQERKTIETFLAQRGEEIEYICRFKQIIRKKKMQDTYEEKMIVFGKNRMFLFRPTAKLDTSWNIFDIADIDSKDGGELGFRLKNKTEFIFVISFKNQDILLDQCRKCFLSNFPTAPRDQIFAIHYERPELEHPGLSECSTEFGDCGGFARTYEAISDRLGIPTSKDVSFDVDNLYELNENKELNLSEFAAPSPAQSKALIEALRYNIYFEKLTIVQSSDSARYTPDVVQNALQILEHNMTLTSLEMQGHGASSSFINSVKSIAKNVSVQHLRFNRCGFDDKAMTSWAREYFANVAHPLITLNFANNGATKTGLTLLIKVLSENSNVTNNLQSLDLSSNKFGQASENMAVLLKACTSLETLSLRNTDLIMSSLAKVTAVPSLKTLDLSNNQLFQKKDNGVELMKKLMESTPSLTSLKVANCRLSSESIVAALGAAKALTSLNISENPLGDDGLIAIFQQLQHGSSVTRLSINNTFGARSKNRSKMLELLTALVTPDGALESNNNNSNPSIVSKCTIRALHIAGSPSNPLRGELQPFVFSLLPNDTLEELDISNHQIGDGLAVALSKVLQANITLHTLMWDGNLTTPAGFRKFRLGLLKNRVLCRMPLPFNDVGLFRLEKQPPEILKKWNELLAEIQVLVQQNNLHTKAFVATPPPVPKPANTLRVATLPPLLPSLIKSSNSLTVTSFVSHVDSSKQGSSKADSGASSSNLTNTNLSASSSLSNIPLTPPSNSKTRRAVALWDFTGDSEGALSVLAREEVEIIDSTSDTEWWEIRNKSGLSGWAPANYLQVQETIASQPNAHDSEGARPSRPKSIHPAARASLATQPLDENSFEVISGLQNLLSGSSSSSMVRKPSATGLSASGTTSASNSPRPAATNSPTASSGATASPVASSKPTLVRVPSQGTVQKPTTSGVAPQPTPFAIAARPTGPASSSSSSNLKSSTLRPARPSGPATNTASVRFPSMRAVGSTSGIANSPPIAKPSATSASTPPAKQTPSTPEKSGESVVPPVPPPSRVVIKTPQEVMAIALYDYDAIDSTTVSFTKGEKMKVLDKEYEEWWRVDLNGKVGLVPANYIEEISMSAEGVPRLSVRASRAYSKRKSINVQRASVIYSQLTQGADPSEMGTAQDDEWE